MRVDERLLKYVSYWTTSSEDSDTIPSTDRQFNLAKELEKELLDLGLQKVTLTDHCYIYGLIPATPGYEDKKAVGFISHMDTAPDFSGKNVKPQIIPDYNGEDVILKGTGDVLKTSDFPELKTLKGRTLITTDGTTLLGADDKAGVAEIMTAAEQLISSDIPHGDIWIGFTPDEEVGRGADLFDLDYFKADFAYTVDGDYEGEVAYENFNAASAVFAVKGVNVHPGEAKDIMVNAALVACEIQSQLPPMETPAHTEGREGFYHLTDMSGDVAAATLSYIIRDHDKVMFETRQKKMQEIADKEFAELILTTGGTGFSERDVTPEATEEVIERRVPGIPEAMRAYSMTITKRAMLSRSTAGIRKKTLIINLPGSPKAVRESLDYIIDALGHGIEILTGEAGNCARK